jgi:DNA primase
MSLSPQFMDELRARTTLSSLIQRTLPLKKAGNEFRACCPFHNEKSPSFYVNDAKGFYHCFGCSAHGDAIRWLTEQQGNTFLEACAMLADQAGMEMPQAGPRDDQRDREMEHFYAVMDRADDVYAKSLWDNGGFGRIATAYLEDRGIDPVVAAAFGLGYAPTSRKGDTSFIADKLRHLAGEEALIKTGLMKKLDGEAAYDFFRGRIMFPIHDHRGRAIAFGGRVIGQGEPKYLNSPDTPLFDKGRTLFNHHRARPAAAKAKRLVIVEGYMDVIALHRAGIPESVAPNGTALTEFQIQTAWRMAETPILCFDGDAAGQRAAQRAAMTALPILEPGKSLAFVTPPAGKDPDDVLREGGAGAVEAMLADPTPMVDMVWRAQGGDDDISTPEEHAALYTRLKNAVDSIRDDTIRQAYGVNLHARYADKQVGGRRASSQRRHAGAARPASNAIEVAIFHGICAFPEVVEAEYEMIDRIKWADERIKALVSCIIDVAIAGGDLHRFTVQSIFQRAGLLDEAVAYLEQRTLPFSFTMRAMYPPGAKKDLLDALLRMKRS